jgi:hypothetical protein
MTKAEAKEKLIKRLRGFNKSPYAANPIVTRERLQEEFHRSRAGIIDNLRNTWWIKLISWAIDWKKLDVALLAGIDYLVADTGDDLIKEWQLAVRTKDLSNEELSAQIVAAVADVFGSLMAYGLYGRSIVICCETKLMPLLDRVIDRNALIERFVLRPIFRHLIDRLKNVGQGIFEVSVALR